MSIKQRWKDRYTRMDDKFLKKLKEDKKLMDQY
jgi:hypothetical protein